MKVTVCFGAIRVVVPCGTGELLVKDLIPEAVRRYKKAAGKEPDSWVVVHHLQTQSGILDPDDRLKDVADDREQILASFEDTGPDPCVPQGGGDGASGSSSVGTGSPDIFRDPRNSDVTATTTVTTNNSNANTSIPHIEVTSTTSVPQSGLGLQVRRSSDPNLVQALKNQSESTKRWSAAAPVCHVESSDRVIDKINHLSPQWEEEDDMCQSSYGPPSQHFARNGRLSMQFLGDGNGYRWIEAAERLAVTSQSMYTTKSLPRETSKRKEPLGQAHESIREKDGEMLLIINEYGGPLGLTAVPDRDNGGLIVQNVEPGSRAERGRLRKGDRILEINGTKLIGMAESKVQEHLRRSLATSELRVRVIRADQQQSRPNRRDNNVSEMVEAEEKSSGTKIATVSPTRKLPGAAVGTSLQVANTRKLGRKIEIILKKGPHGLGFSVTTRDNPAGGHCPIYIKNILPRGAAIEDGRLKPGDRLLEVDGLPMTGKTQAEVVSILRATQPGATVRIIVSRQQELEEEREVGLQNLSEEQEDAISIPPKPPAPIPPPSSTSTSFEMKANINKENEYSQINSNHNEQHFIDAGNESAASSDSLQAGIAWRNREVLTLHIPVHDTEKAGLGVSVKGKTSSLNSSNGSNSSIKHDGDLGIFVKNVIHGGAASRDGRLRMNDQLLSVNGISLLGQSNAEAMETLRRAMLHTPGKHPGVITLSVARKISRSHSSGDILDSTNDSSNNSENSGATVIYLTPEKKELKDHLNRWSNPVLDRLTGGICTSDLNNKRSTPLSSHALRNESYYMATNDNWTPSGKDQLNSANNSVLIEDDTEPLSPVFPNSQNDSNSTPQNRNQNCDVTYASQLSLETNTSVEAFSRDAIGRRSISEKHHAALDARETGTYQRNKKLREERERERRLQLTKSAILSGSVESLTRISMNNTSGPIIASKSLVNGDLKLEAMDRIGDLGPSLGLKKSSSLESLQTMVQEIQMSDDVRGPSALRAPRGRGREDGLRAAVVGGTDINKPRKHWLLEDGDHDGGFVNRNGPFQSSLNEGKNKNRTKKPSILKGIGHMFRFGKHRKDGVTPVETTANHDFGQNHSNLGSLPPQPQHIIERTKPAAPPSYQPPPPPVSTKNGGIQQNDIFNHRYQHYVNYDELQQQIRGTCVELSQSVIESMRAQVMRQRYKVELESRRHQHYHSQRSARNHQQELNSQHPHHSSLNRPISSYYEYETVHNITGGINSLSSSSSSSGTVVNHQPSSSSTSSSSSAAIATRKGIHTSTTVTSSPPRNHWKAATMNGFGPGGGSGRNRGPFVTQVTIRDQTSHQQQPHLNNGVGPPLLPSSSSASTSSSSTIITSSYQHPQKQQHSQHSYHHQITKPPPHASKV